MKNLISTFVFSVLFSLVSFGQTPYLTDSASLWQNNPSLSVTSTEDSTLVGATLVALTGAPSPTISINGVVIKNVDYSLYWVPSRGKSIFDTTFVVNKGDIITFTETLASNNDNSDSVYVYLTDLSTVIGLWETELPTIEVELYPNPTTDVINVKGLDTYNTTEYQVFNLNGQLVKRGSFNEQIYVSDLPSGVYILSMNVDGTRVSEKFIKR